MSYGNLKKIGMKSYSEEIQIPRPVLICKYNKIEFHGFCDASEKAYGAIIYICSIDTSKNVKVNILCSKSKVAPLQKKER